MCIYYVCLCVCKMWEWHKKGLKSLTSTGKESEELIFFLSKGYNNAYTIAYSWGAISYKG